MTPEWGPFSRGAVLQALRLAAAHGTPDAALDALRDLKESARQFDVPEVRRELHSIETILTTWKVRA